MGLRYDLTLPLSRYYAANREQVLHHDVVQHRQAEQKPQRHLEGTRPVTAAVQRTAAGALTCGSQ